jgi:hypothetical protein
VFAHHSASLYDGEVDVSIEGPIVRVDWANPHTYLWVREDTAGGKQVTWEIEGSPAAYLRRHGWTKDTLNVGDSVTVKGNPGREPDGRIAVLRSIQKSDRVLDRDLPTALAAIAENDAAISERASSLSGTWGTIYAPEAMRQFARPWAGRATEEGQAAVDAFAADSFAADCTPQSAPRVMLSPDIKLIEVRRDVVLIRREWDGVERTVYLSVDSHDRADESIQGHSIGRWDGNALVIDTARFTPQRSGNASGLPSGRGKHLVERLELNEDGSRLTYGFELEDPEYLTEPITGELQWAYRPDLEYVGLPCDVDSAGRFLR